MNRNRHIGLELRDGFDVGRDPRHMSADELQQLGHAQVSPLRALRLKCLDCCNGYAQEVRLCTAVDCPNWPFRMGKNPWRAPLDDAEQERRSVMMRRNRASASTSPEKTRGQIDASSFDGVQVPSEPSGDFPQVKARANHGVAS